MSLAALESYKKLRGLQKWGFIIYRCDYRDDSAWAHFMERWSQRVNEWLIRMNERQLIKNLEWTVREDRASLDGATVEDVRTLFTAWTKTEEAVAERQHDIDRRLKSSGRYDYCIHVDAKALDACLRFDVLPQATQDKFWHMTRDPALGHAPYINIVEKIWEVEGCQQYDDEEEDSEEEEEAISFKAHWLCAVPDFFNNLNGSLSGNQFLIRDCDQDGVCG